MDGNQLQNDTNEIEGLTLDRPLPRRPGRCLPELWGSSEGRGDAAGMGNRGKWVPSYFPRI
jgi:hypothetical protein